MAYQVFVKANYESAKQSLEQSLGDTAPVPNALVMVELASWWRETKDENQENTIPNASRTRKKRLKQA